MCALPILQVLLDHGWESLDDVAIEDGSSIIIGREEMPAELDAILEKDLDATLGIRAPKLAPAERISVQYTDNELQKVVYLPSRANSNTVSRGHLRRKPRPGFDVSSNQFVPAYLQVGHTEIEILGDHIRFSDLGSSNGTWIQLA